MCFHVSPLSLPYAHLLLCCRSYSVLRFDRRRLYGVHYLRMHRLALTCAKTHFIFIFSLLLPHPHALSFYRPSSSPPPPPPMLSSFSMHTPSHTHTHAAPFNRPTFRFFPLCASLFCSFPNAADAPNRSPLLLLLLILGLYSVMSSILSLSLTSLTIDIFYSFYVYSYIVHAACTSGCVYRVNSGIYLLYMLLAAAAALLNHSPQRRLRHTRWKEIEKNNREYKTQSSMR